MLPMKDKDQLNQACLQSDQSTILAPLKGFMLSTI